MKKKTQKNNPPLKSIFQKLGETVGSIGYEMVAGKDKLVEAAHKVTDQFSEEKKEVIKKVKKTAKKTARKVAEKKATVKKEMKKVGVKAAAKAKKGGRKFAKKTVSSISKKN